MKNLRTILCVAFIAAAVMFVTGCSCRTWHNFWGDGQAEPAEAFFWDKQCKVVKAAEKPAPKPEKKPYKPAEKPMVAMNTSSVVHPCEGCGVVKVHKKMPAEVALDQQFDYYIMVTNLTDKYVTDVKVTEKLADNFKFVKAEPASESDGDTLMWSMAKLAPNQTQKIKVTGVATSSGDIKHCTDATYKMPACAMTKVVKPMLAITKTAPEMVLLCDKIAIKYTVKNEGTGATTGVKITEKLPEGLVKAEGGNMVNIPVGTLAPGESKSFSVMAMAEKTGKYASKAMATADGDMKAASAETATAVKQPVLAIEKSGRDMVYLTRNVTYDIKVSNTGDAAAANTVVQDMIPQGAKFVSATMGGQVQTDKVVWNLGSLAPEASKSMSVTYAPSGIGKVGGKAMAMAECAKAVDAAAMTDVKGIAAVLLEVVDLSDPIEVGGNETYQIIVTNQGSATATNINVMANLEDTMEFVSGSGASNAAISGEEVKFATLKSLAPKAKATWNLVVKAVKEGDVRIEVEMDCDQIERPVRETESTHFYE